MTTLKMKKKTISTRGIVMNKQKQKDLLGYQLDHQPQKWQWKNTALMVAIISGVMGILLIATECLINFEGCWS